MHIQQIPTFMPAYSHICTHTYTQKLCPHPLIFFSLALLEESYLGRVPQELMMNVLKC